MTMEHCTGWNLSAEPPLIALWRPVARWPGPRASRNELYVVRPTFEGDKLVLPPPTLVTRRHLGMTQAAGGASFAATSGSTSFIVWSEVAPVSASGSPTYVAGLDRRTGRLTTPVLVGRAHPPNDDHGTAGICLDGQGYLHVVMGAHGRPFRYVHSVRPSMRAPGPRRGPCCRRGSGSGEPTPTGAAGRPTSRRSACPTTPWSCVPPGPRRAGPGSPAVLQRPQRAARPSGGKWSSAAASSAGETATATRCTTRSSPRMAAGASSSR